MFVHLDKTPNFNDGVSTAFPLTTGGITSGPTSPACPYCSGWHSGECHRVKAKEYYPDGSIKRIEFHERELQAPGYIFTPLVPQAPQHPWNQPWFNGTTELHAQTVSSAQAQGGQNEGV